MSPIGICRIVNLSDVKVFTYRSGVDCMTNPPDAIVMEHIPTKLQVFCELGHEGGSFYRGYLLAYLEQELQRGERGQILGSIDGGGICEICRERANIRADRYREALIDAERVLEWGEPDPKPVLQRVRNALRGGEEG